jgi:hypothetical protein
VKEATHIRALHPYAFRSGRWARIRTIAPAPPEEADADDPFTRLRDAFGVKPRSRDCYVVEFPDGKTDFWVVDDPAAEYEFRYEDRP